MAKKKLTITAKAIHAFLEHDGKNLSFKDWLECNECVKPPCSKAAFEAMKKLDLCEIISGTEMSENHLGGDDLVDVAHQTVQAIKSGYEVVTWYGDESEALVLGYRESEVTIETSEVGASKKWW